MKLTIVGSGYVGLVAGTCFADSGNDVICVDVDATKIKALNAGKIPIYEPGLEELVHKNVREKRLSFSTDLAGAVGQSEVVFIAVGTPEGETGDADLQHVLAAAEQIGKALKRYTIVVDKSTVPVGTADRVRETIAKVTDQPFDVVSNPEFLKEGAAIDDFFKPDRVVIGTNSEHARKIMGELYGPFVRTENPILYMDPRSAELTKYAANAMLATRISFMNDMAHALRARGRRRGRGPQGPGRGQAHRLPVPLPRGGLRRQLLPQGREGPGGHRARLRDRVRPAPCRRAHQRGARSGCCSRGPPVTTGTSPGKHFAVWGLAFKPRTDDMREAPSVVMIEGLLGKGATLAAHDPVADPRGQAPLRRPHSLHRDAVRGPGEGGRPVRPHRVERVPPARTSTG